MKKTLLVAFCIFALAAAACAPADSADPTPTASPDDPVSSDDPQPTFDLPTAVDPDEFTFGKAIIDSAEVLILESFPVQVNVQINGSLQDGCTELHRIDQVREENTFFVTVETIRPVDEECTEALVPFTEVTSLDVAGLPAGEYTVDVNGFTTSFELQVDNVAPQGMDAGGEMTVAEAMIDDVEVVAAAEDDSAAAPEVQISGSLNDACTELGEITDEYDEETNTVRVTVLTERPSDMICAQVIEPFSTTYELTSVPGPGEYTLSVNGVEIEFTVEE